MLHNVTTLLYPHLFYHFLPLESDRRMFCCVVFPKLTKKNNFHNSFRILFIVFYSFHNPFRYLVNAFRHLVNAFRRLVDTFCYLVNAFRRLVDAFRQRNALMVCISRPFSAYNCQKCACDCQK